MLELRYYQNDAVNDIRSSFKQGHKSPMLVLSTGGGKTVIFCHIANQAASRGKRVLILVHRVELLRQTSKSLKKSSVNHGLINPKFTPNLTANVQVASVQTLVRRLDKVIPPDLIIIDECHHGNAGSWKKIIDYYSDALVLGVTATPIRGDGKGLGDIFSDLIMGPQITELIDQGFLTKPRLFGPPNHIDMSQVKTVRGDYDKEQTVKIVDKPTITGNAVSEYSKLCPGQPAVAFCISVKHAEHVAAEFRSAGYRSYSVDGSMDDDTRTRILNGLEDGSVQVVTSCDIISEGTDIPAIVCAIMLRPTKSTGLYIQQGGRALRPIYANGYDLNTQHGRLSAIKNGPKPHAIILDHVGNYALHGYLDMDRDWKLEKTVNRKRNKSTKIENFSVSQCPKCYVVFEPQPICPSCGNEMKIERKPEIVEGELKEITDEERRQIKFERRREVAMAETLEDLKNIGKSRGYKPNWAYIQWNLRNQKLI